MDQTRRGMIALSGLSLAALSGCTDGLTGVKGDEDPSEPRSTQEPNQQEKEQLIAEYEDGLEKMDAARSEFDSGQSELEQERFTSASASFSSAGSEAGDARDHFKESIRLAGVIENSTAGKEAEDAEQFGVHIGAACMHNAVAAELLKDGHNEKATNELEAGSEQLDMATDIDVAKVDYMAEIVGISSW